MRSCVAIVVFVACRSSDPPKVAQDPSFKCEAAPFAESTPVAEASGAAWVTAAGKPALLVISDSGNLGAYTVVDADTGETREQGQLPLAGPGDDIEGIAARGDDLFGLTSSGWMYHWARKGAGYALAEPPYPIGGGDFVCATAAVANCGKNYEGLAIGAHSAFACSKTEGTLYALVEKGGHFVVDGSRTIHTSEKNRLGDCAFSQDGTTLWVGDNIYGLNAVYRVDPATSKVVALGPYGVGNSEVIAARGDQLYRMSDSNGAPSLMAKFRCQAIVP